MLPVPSLRVPFQTAVALVVGILYSFRRVGNAIPLILAGNRAGWALVLTGRDPLAAGGVISRRCSATGGRLPQPSPPSGDSILSCLTHLPTQDRPTETPPTKVRRTRPRLPANPP